MLTGYDPIVRLVHFYQFLFAISDGLLRRFLGLMLAIVYHIWFCSITGWRTSNHVPIGIRSSPLKFALNTYDWSLNLIFERLKA